MLPLFQVDFKKRLLSLKTYLLLISSDSGVIYDYDNIGLNNTQELIERQEVPSRPGTSPEN
jgi:hypothetical protein